MDDFELQGPELKRTLRDLQRINYLLGGNSISLDGVKQLLKDAPGKREIKILDIGCGNGDILRRIALWGNKYEYSLQLIGIDANEHTIKIAREESQDFPEINFMNLDVFSNEFKSLKCDIILCTLTLHHFKDAEITQLLNSFYHQVSLGIVINDLHRTKTAYVLFKLFCAGFVQNKIAREDGLTSILRGFKKKDVLEFSRDLPGKHQIKWKWAFRYQWIIKRDY